MFFAGHLKHFLSVIPAKAGIQIISGLRLDSISEVFRPRSIFLIPSPPPRGRGKGEGESTNGTVLIFGALMICLFLVVRPALSATPPDLEDRTREIATELRCVVCQNLSVADSPSEMAQQMRAVVREQLEAGKTPDQVKEFFVSKYGEWVLLKPKTTGFSALLWILPYAALAIGIAGALWFIRRWSNAKKTRSGQANPVVTAEAQDEFLTHDYDRPNVEDASQRAQLLRERGRLKDELAELDFDFQSGKLSEADYQMLKREIEIKGAAVTQQLSALPAPAVIRPKEKQPRAVESKGAPAHGRSRRWQLVAGGAFLLLFGLGLGVMLTQSIRPRASENDSMTGDFMTGTMPPSGEARAALAEGKQAFAQQDFPKAIDAFKKALAADPNNPEAHAYMGFILIQAGHGDGALMAFDKALSVAPNFAMALWGRGMVLYQHKKDYAGAREIFERLLNTVPPGEERNEIAKLLAEMPSAPAGKPAAPTAAPSPPSAQISGKITVDPKLKASIDPTAALFIIARSAGAGGGPPLAVKKIDKPVFPLAYSLSQENVMIQGTPFTGKITLTVRLDKDGNPTTRGPGDLIGDYKKNPLEVGAKNVDVVIDQAVK
jgi:cytochrome c-type biogenesis protein CcmH